MNAVVLGNGRSGKAAAELLRHEGWSVSVLDGEDVWPTGAWDLCVTSPGVPLDHPWQKAARASGVPVASELQLGVERYHALGGRMLAITGSKGKSSVVKLVADALGGIPCGNYGKPLCEVVLEFRQQSPKNPHSNPLAPQWAIVEVSSFQMETTELQPDAFEAAAILNLQEDHLDRHGSVAVYHGLKRKLLSFSKFKIMGTDPCSAMGTDPNALNALGTDPLREMADVELLAGSYFDNPVLLANGLCAVALLRTAGMDSEAIRAAFARFEPLPHRMQTVGSFGGVTWIDDSKATSISALVAGVAMAAHRFSGSVPKALGSVPNTFNTLGSVPKTLGSVPKVRLIAGGLPKGDDLAMAKGELSVCVRKVYLIGQCAEKMEAAWKESVPCERCGTLERAVESAARDAEKGDCVLLSPGTASFDQFKSYAERGNRFSELVSSLR